MRLCFISPRYGSTFAGGAETLVRNFAEHLAEKGHVVSVLTTCASDLFTWANDQPEGESSQNGVTVHRFPITVPSDRVVMAQLQFPLDHGLPLPPRYQHQWLMNTGYSAPLLEAISQASSRVDALVFAPYLFASTVFGAQVCPEKSVIIPCLHDEPYVSFEETKATLQGAAGLLFNTEGEQKLAQRTLGHLPKNSVVGSGIEEPIEQAHADRFRAKSPFTGAFVSYAGRKDIAKNFDLLDLWMSHYTGAYPDEPTKLVVMGNGRHTPDRISNSVIHDLGFVSTRDKFDIFSASVATANLSLNESFSFMIMESWLSGTPVIVHARCDVTRQHCKDSGGGLWVENAAEFIEAVHLLRTDPILRADLGAAGRCYVREHYAWPTVLERFERAVSTMVS